MGVRSARLLAPQNAAERLAGPAGRRTISTHSARWEQPHCCGFTAHPTFLLSPQQSDAVAAAVGNGEAASVSDPHERPEITLGYEHDRAMAAMPMRRMRATASSKPCCSAQQAFPDRWHEARPLPFRFASWVGYDMDGRTDIKWYTSIAFRLAEKAQRLDRYAAPSKRSTRDSPCSSNCVVPRHGRMPARRSSRGPVRRISAANRLTADHDDKLLSLQPLIDRSSEARVRKDARSRAEDARGRDARRRSRHGLIHFRVNAKQLHNAIRTRLGEAADIDLSSRGAIAALHFAGRGGTAKRQLCSSQ